jgi:hypothetical protein
VATTVERQPGLPDAHLSFTAHRLSQAAELADLQLLPHIDMSPFQVLTFLLQHPFITLFAAASLYFVVPRLVKAGIRFVVVPAALALALYLVSLNPSAAVDLTRGALDCARLYLLVKAMHASQWPVGRHFAACNLVYILWRLCMHELAWIGIAQL